MPVYHKEDLNFFRLAKCVHGYSTAALRKVFKHEWNKLYTSTPWQNNTTSGSQLLGEEKSPLRHSRLYDPRYCNEYRHIKNHLSSGNVENWDISTLAFALNYSHALSPARDSVRGKKITRAANQIREVRNEVLAHASSTSMSDDSFETNVKTLITAVQNLLTEFDPIVHGLWQMLTEGEFTTNEPRNESKCLKNDHDRLRSDERVVHKREERLGRETWKIEERPEHKRKGPHRDETRKSHRSDQSKTASNLPRHEITESEPYTKESATTPIYQVPPKWKLDILTRRKYIKLMDSSNFLSFNFCWRGLENFLQGFRGNAGIEIFARIQSACALNQRSRKEESLKMLNGLIPFCGSDRENGFLAYARIRICMALVLHDIGKDEEALKHADEAEIMLSEGECYEDSIEIHNAKGNIILSRRKNSTEDRKRVLYHFNKALELCENVPVDKSVIRVQMTIRKALVHLGYYQHDIVKEVERSDVDVAETILNQIPSRQIMGLSERSKIYYEYCQALLSLRKGDYERTKKMEQEVRRKCRRQSLHNEIQQLDVLRGLLSEQVEETTSD